MVQVNISNCILKNSIKSGLRHLIMIIFVLKFSFGYKVLSRNVLN